MSDIWRDEVRKKETEDCQALVPNPHPQIQGTWADTKMQLVEKTNVMMLVYIS